MSAIIVPASLLRDIESHCEAGYPEEVVGVMIGRETGSDRVVTELIRLENMRVENRQRRYTVDPLQLAKIERDTAARNLLVLGFYHSHPDHPAEPSPTDLEWAWPFYSYIIQSVQQRSAAVKRSWRLADDEKSFWEEEIRES
ncbi:MAG: M67 family metallopeptidase [Candidatus Hydrogenedentota bacterium]